ncbi:MAG TPA: pyridoxine 5'-phosphate oxidase C-terminal domain-containing protein, partial [Verrucomicrobiae bacterium]
EMPAQWGGYILAPIRIEFWQGRPNRLHDRFQYSKQADGAWRIDRLSP